MDLNTELLQRRMKWNGCYSGGVKRAAAVASSISFLGSLKLFYSDITRALKGRYCRFRCYLHTTISRSFSLKGSLLSILQTLRRLSINLNGQSRLPFYFPRAFAYFPCKRIIRCSSHKTFLSLKTLVNKKGQKLQFPSLELLFCFSLRAGRLTENTNCFPYKQVTKKCWKSLQTSLSSLMRLRHRMVTANVSQRTRWTPEPRLGWIQENWVRERYKK